MQVSILNTSSAHSASAAEELCWAHISTAINAPGNPIDSGYVDQAEVCQRVASICTSYGVQDVSSLLLTAVFLAWRSRYLVGPDYVHVWADNVTFEEPDDDDAEYLYHSCMVYPDCPAKIGDAVSLYDIKRCAGQEKGLSVSPEILDLLRDDLRLPTGDVNYSSLERQVRTELARALRDNPVTTSDNWRAGQSRLAIMPAQGAPLEAWVAHLAEAVLLAMQA